MPQLVASSLGYPCGTRRIYHLAGGIGKGGMDQMIHKLGHTVAFRPSFRVAALRHRGIRGSSTTDAGRLAGAARAMQGLR